MSVWQLMRGAGLFVLLGVAVGTVQHLQAAEPNNAHSIPPESLAIVQIDVPDLCQSPNFAFLIQAARRVASETSDYSLTKLGIDVTTLTEVTVVVPPVDRIMEASASNRSPVVVAVTFAEPFRADVLMARLEKELDLVAVGNGMYHRADSLALFVASDQTLVAGSPTSLAWWLDARQQQGANHLVQALSETIPQGPIRVGCDLSGLQPFVASLPRAMQKLFQAGVATAALDMDDKLTVELNFRYDSEADAQGAVQELGQLIAQGKALLTVAEIAAQRSLDDPDTSATDGLGRWPGWLASGRPRRILTTSSWSSMPHPSGRRHESTTKSRRP